MAKRITYANKVRRGTEGAVKGITDTWRAIDANEVKDVVNAHAEILEQAAEKHATEAIVIDFEHYTADEVNQKLQNFINDQQKSLVQLKVKNQYLPCSVTPSGDSFQFTAIDTIVHSDATPPFVDLDTYWFDGETIQHSKISNVISDGLSVLEQTLTEAQKTQARQNIGALSSEDGIDKLIPISKSIEIQLGEQITEHVYEGKKYKIANFEQITAFEEKWTNLYGSLNGCRLAVSLVNAVPNRQAEEGGTYLLCRIEKDSNFGDGSFYLGLGNPRIQYTPTAFANLYQLVLSVKEQSIYLNPIKTTDGAHLIHNQYYGNANFLNYAKANPNQIITFSYKGDVSGTTEFDVPVEGIGRVYPDPVSPGERALIEGVTFDGKYKVTGNSYRGQPASIELAKNFSFVDAINAQIATLSTDVSTINGQITEINGQITELQNDFAEAIFTMVDLIRAAIDLTGTDDDRKTKIAAFATQWSELAAPGSGHDMLGAKFVGQIQNTADNEVDVVLFTYDIAKSKYFGISGETSKSYVLDASTGALTETPLLQTLTEDEVANLWATN